MRPVRSLLLAALCLALGFTARAETQSVIDPNEGSEPPAPPASSVQRPNRPDPALRRERQRAAEEQRRRAQAEARAAAAEREAERLRASEQARQQAEAAQKEAERKAAARRAAAAKEAEKRAAVRAAASQATAARIKEDQEAAERDAAARAAAARELAAREAAAREIAAREAALREASAKEAAARAASQEEARYQAQWKRVAPRDLRQASVPARPGGSAFRDCSDCPEMVWLPPGRFVMGEGAAMEGARAEVSINYALAVGRFEVTFSEWDACAADGGCRRRPADAGWGRGSQPVINISWTDAKQYAAWLSHRTGKRYRLLTEAEWEYAARSGTDSRYWWGNHTGNGEANCYDCGSKWDGRQAAPVGRFSPNPFGLHDMHGNVSEWVEDCYRDRHREAPGDGKAWMQDCGALSEARMVRGGAWRSTSRSTRATARSSAAQHYFDNQIGFRVARTD